MVNYIDKLKQKCKVNETFYDIVSDLFNKLINFGYITRHGQKKLERKLYENIDTILIGNDLTIDYKTGYYDPIRKELYIKDLKNIESVYLRVLYILTTSEIINSSYTVGYSTVSLSKANYKIEHKNFGLNRAVISNLVCRLLYTQPITLSIMPTYKTYQNDFLGNKITSDNDIYFLEGKLLKQICYIFNLHEENLYINLFSTPKKYIDKFFNKMSLETQNRLLSYLDILSRNYSHHSKLAFLNQKLDLNYIEIKKAMLKSNTTKLVKEKATIKLAIRNALIPLIYQDNDDVIGSELDNNIDSCLSEQINRLEEEIVDNISSIQNILVEYLISSESRYSSIMYAIRLKELEKLLIVKNELLEESLFNTISMKLMNSFEYTASNLTEKIKFSIINEILSNNKFIKIYKNIKFNKLTSIELSDNTALIVLCVDDSFLQFVKVDSLDLPMKDLKDNAKFINVENMSYLLNNPAITKDIQKYEKIFTLVHRKSPKFSNIRIENMFLINVLDNTFVMVLHDDTFSMLKIHFVNNRYTLKEVELSESYNVFSLNNLTNLPALYKNNETFLQKAMSFFSFFS
ncbi:MAG: hypothetical protein PHP54_01415 [Clostridia bacterium]|nr:hypothetical protein [Clostridia bacterium]